MKQLLKYSTMTLLLTYSSDIIPKRPEFSTKTSFQKKFLKYNKNNFSVSLDSLHWNFSGEQALG